MKFRTSKFTTRIWLILAHDLVMTAVAVLATFYVRFEDAGLAERARLLTIVLPIFVAYAGFVYFFSGLYRAKWRFTSLPDLFNIVRAAAILTGTLLALDYVLLSPNLYGTFFFGKITIALYLFLQVFFLAGPRIAYRYFRYTRVLHHARTEQAAPVLVLGRTADADVLLRAIESGAVQKIRAVGILSPSHADQNQAIRGVSVLGGFAELEPVVADLASRGTRVSRIVMTASALAPEMEPETTLMRARRLGLATSRLPSLDEGGEALRLAPVNVEDLLLRPSVKIDYRRLEEFVKGRAVVVTGGGGSIGAEICDRIVTFGAGRLLIIENSELALHAVLETLAAKEATTQVDGRIADIRDRHRIFRLVEEFKPDIVFHAAALKHVPLLGATKRFAEMYCQALDADFARRVDGGRRPMRLIAVRFGNVLASNGSVVPKFKAQIEAGGPVTVTHPDMVRYFMTIREACDLVVTAASHALGPQRSDVSVFVLNMGQP